MPYFFSTTSKIKIYKLKLSNSSNFNIVLWFLIIWLYNDDASVSVAMADACTMVYVVCLFMKTHLLALLQDNCLDLIRCAFLHKLSGCVRNITVLTTPTEADKIGHFGRYLYIGKTQISAQYISQADISVCL